MDHYLDAKGKLWLFATSVGEHHPIGWGPNRQKGRGSVNFLSVWAETYFSCLQTLVLLVLQLSESDQVLHHQLANSQAFRLGLNYTTGFSSLQTTDGGTSWFPITVWAYSYIYRKIDVIDMDIDDINDIDIYRWYKYRCISYWFCFPREPWLIIWGFTLQNHK